MLIMQVTPQQALTESYATQVGLYIGEQVGHPDMSATRRQMERLPSDLKVVSGIKAILPALVYLPNRHDSPPSLAIGVPDDLNSEFLHSNLKAKVRSTQKSREFRSSPVTSALLVEDGTGTHLFLDDDSEDAPQYVTEQNKDLFKKLYDIEDVFAGNEFGSAGLSLVGLVRVIGGARKKAELKHESENALVDRFLLETFAALARNGKSSEVYASLVRENSNLRKTKKN